MSKTIKLSDKQIKNYVRNIVEEVDSEISSDTEQPKPTVPGGAKLTLAMDKNGNYYIIKDAYTDKPVLVYKES